MRPFNYFIDRQQAHKSGVKYRQASVDMSQRPEESDTEEAYGRLEPGPAEE